MAEKIATREAYGKALVEMGAKYENLVVLDADLAAATKTGMFKKAYPDRFIDCGIAENNMIGVAAGLALSGKIPFASSFASDILTSTSSSAQLTPARPSARTARPISATRTSLS